MMPRGALLIALGHQKAAEILGGPLNDAMRRGVEVTCVVAKRVTDEVRASFAKTGVALTEDESATCPGLAVLDRRRIWYGTIPLLAFPQADDCSIRFESAEAAHDLLEGLSPGQRGEATD